MPRACPGMPVVWSQCLEYAIERGSVDVILVAHNFGQDPKFFQKFTSTFDFVARQPDLPRVLQQAKAKGVGVVAMKTLMGARLNDMRPFEKGGATFAQAAFRWVLSNPDVDGLIISMTSPAALMSTWAPRVGGRRRTTTCRSCSAMRRCRGRPIAATPVTTARAPARMVCPSPTCCAPGCTRRITATCGWRAVNMPCSARGPRRVSPARRNPVRVPARTRLPINTLLAPVHRLLAT